MQARRKEDDPISCDVPEIHHVTPLFHATNRLNEVIEEGLKPRCEHQNKCGLGNPGNEMISFTYSLDYASLIADETKRFARIARGDINWENIKNLVGSDTITRGGSTGLDVWDKEIEGFYDWNVVQRTQRNLFYAYKNRYLPMRRFQGGKEDPVFSSADFEPFKGIDPSDVGVVSVQAYLPYPLGELIETRKQIGIFGGPEKLVPKEGCYEFIGGPEHEIRLRKGMFGQLTPS